MFKLYTIVTIIYLAVSTSALVDLEWWQKTIIYQIYPRSFRDTNGDGVGDLKGITSKLDHFDYLNVKSIWLSPIFSSPMKDFGYDVSNFTEIEPLFGTMEDFDMLLKTAHAQGIKIILDFIPNHSSNEHEWFLQSKQSRNNECSDFYLWADPKEGCPSPSQPLDNLEQCLPNNWISLFGGSAWEWAEERRQFYFHQFLVEQPDLNFRNDRVKDEMTNVLRFWLEKGVDGFRVDAIKHMFEVGDLSMNEPANPYYVPRPDEKQVQYDSLFHNYTTELPELHDVIKEWRKLFQEYSTDGQYRFMVTESYDTPKNLLPYYGTKEMPEADFPFNFQLLQLTKENFNGNNLYQLINDWLSAMPEGAWANWVIGNHDNFRVADRIGIEHIKLVNVLLLLLPGTPTTYYGEEIGMENIWVSYNDTQDPYAKNNPCCWEDYTRDPERSPMQWTSQPPFADFSDNAKIETWLPVNDNYQNGINVEDQTGEESTTLEIYRLLAQKRESEPALQQGDIFFGLISEQVFSFLRELEEDGHSRFLVVMNVGSQTVVEDFQQAFADHQLPNQGTVLIDTNWQRQGLDILIDQLELQPGESLVIELIENGGADGSTSILDKTRNLYFYILVTGFFTFLVNCF